VGNCGSQQAGSGRRRGLPSVHPGVGADVGLPILSWCLRLVVVHAMAAMARDGWWRGAGNRGARDGGGCAHPHCRRPRRPRKPSGAVDALATVACSVGKRNAAVFSRNYRTLKVERSRLVGSDGCTSPRMGRLNGYAWTNAFTREFPYFYYHGVLFSVIDISTLLSKVSQV
jgi:hypothetical protein